MGKVYRYPCATISRLCDMQNFDTITAMESQNNWRWGMQLLLGLILASLFCFMMMPFFIPILLGAMIALLSYPTFNRLNKKLPPTASAGIVTVGVTSGVIVPIVFLLIKGSHQISAALKKMKIPTTSGDEILAHPVVRKAIVSVSRFAPLDREWLQGQLGDLFESVISHVSTWVGVFLAGMPGLVLNFFIMIVSFYFFLVDGSRFLKFLSTLSPMGRQKSTQLFNAFQNSCRGVVLGLFASAAIQGLLILFFFALARVPNAILFGTLGVFMGMVPVVGTAPVTLGGIAYLFFTGEKLGAFVLVLGAMGIATIDNVVRSWILKGASEMHPLLALISALGATVWMGPPGIFLGPIIAAVFLSFLNILTSELGDSKR